MEEKEFKEKLKQKASKIGIELTEKQLQLFYAYKEEVLGWNEKINLTAIKEDEEFLNKHFIDSLTIIKYIKDENEKIIDIGTGAGFPGIPVKIVKNNSIILFDALAKRLKVLDDIIQKLNLSGIQTLHGRAEETFQNKEYRERFDIATSRAVANLNVLVEYMLPAVKVNGLCICMKAGEVEEELKQAKNAIELLGGKVEKVEKIILPDTTIQRNIILIRKVKNTPKKYPRRPGTPTKEPLL